MYSLQCGLCANIFKATLHIIPLISFAGLKSKVREMTLSEINEVAWLFRTPNHEFYGLISLMVGWSLMHISQSQSPGSNGEYYCKDCVTSLNHQL